MSRYVVILNTGLGQHAFGPIEDREYARRFAAFMTREVDPAEAVKLIDPLDELLAYEKRMEGLAKDEPAKRPLNWPPSPGEIWQDKGGDRWVCTRATGPGVSYLTCLARMADDSAEEIWRQHGPMSRISFIAPTEEEEPPF